MNCSKVPGLANAHVDRNESRSLSKVTRDQGLSGSRSQIEVAILGADNIWARVVAVNTGRRKRRTLSEEPIASGILTGNDVEGRAGTRHDERIQGQLPPRETERAREGEAMSHVESSAAKLAGQIIRVGWKNCAALAVAVISCLV